MGAAGPPRVCSHRTLLKPEVDPGDCQPTATFFLPSSFPFPFHVKRFLCLGNAQTFAKEISKGFADS